MFLLDDHEVVRQGLRALLESTGSIEVVGEAGTAAEAAARIPALHPDVAVLDARLPDGSGIEVCRTVRAVDPTIRALILTSYDDDEALFAAIMAGASGYVLKDVKGLDLVAAIRASAHHVLEHAQGNDLLHAVVSATHGADTELLPLLTTHAESLLVAAKAVIAERITPYDVALDGPHLDAAIDMVVRVVLSHVMQPSGDPAETAEAIAWIAARVLG